GRGAGPGGTRTGDSRGARPAECKGRLTARSLLGTLGLSSKLYMRNAEPNSPTAGPAGPIPRSACHGRFGVTADDQLDRAGALHAVAAARDRPGEVLRKRR